MNIRVIFFHRLRVHSDHQIDALTPPKPSGLRNTNLVPRRKSLDVRWKNVLRRNGNTETKYRLRKKRVRRCGAGAVDVGKTNYEVVNLTIAARLILRDLFHHI